MIVLGLRIESSWLSPLTVHIERQIAGAGAVLHREPAKAREIRIKVHCRRRETPEQLCLPLTVVSLESS
jgi:hypothetical protein